MFKHYIVVAIRNLLKYKAQSLISVIGLAIGFTCFALATLWMRYEQTYDTFHDGADRIYLVRHEEKTSNNGLSSVNPYPLAGYLKATFPEVEEAGNVQAWETSIKYKGVEHKSFKMDVDSAAMRIFDIQILSGSNNFLQANSTEVAVTPQFAKKLFGNDTPIGKEIEIYGRKRTVCAIVQPWSQHSNMPYEMVGSCYSEKYKDEWSVGSWQTFIKLQEGIDMESFLQKLYDHTYTKEGAIVVDNNVATPITAMRYDRPNREQTVKFEHIRLFALAGGLVILCSLFNYLTLFITRIRMRGREIALRKVSGSSNRELLSMFSIEYIVTLALAIFLGLILLELAIPAFKELSEIKSDKTSIYLEAFIYSGSVAILSFLLSIYPIYYSRKKSLNTALKGSSDGKGKNSFQRISIVLQLIISIGFIFCSTILMKQIHHLNHTDLGIERKGRATIQVYPGIEGLKDELGKIPYITTVLPDNLPGFLPRSSKAYQSLREWEGKTDSIPNVTFEIIDCSETFFQFYGLEMVKGTFPTNHKEMMINETAVLQMRLNDPIGKTIQERVITGIVKDFYITPPTIPCRPMMFRLQNKKFEVSTSDILIQYQEENWLSCKKRIEELIKRMNPNVIHYNIITMEEEYQKFLKSENALLMMLDFVTVVCVLISLFGVFSLVTLDCEKRRKEIAIRKVNGAETGHIIKVFLLKYMLFLLIASTIAFPIGYLIMKPWIEGYVHQTRIDFWIYPAIWSSLALLIITCTGWRIWNAANQNPAEVIKSE